MFDIVAKNKKLSFLVSFINEHVTLPQPTIDTLLKIQKNNIFVQKKIKTLKKKTIQSTFNVKSSYNTNRQGIIKTNTRTPRNTTHSTTRNKPTRTPTRTPIPKPTHTSTYVQKNDEDNIIPYSSLYTSNHKTIILDSVTQTEYMIYAFLICIDSNFIHTHDHLKKDLIQTLKYKLAVELDTRNLYKEFKYNKIRSLKKTILQSSLFNNKDIQYIHLYRYIGDYFNVNFIYIIDGIFVQYFNEYKQDRIHIVIAQNKDTVCIDTHSYNDELIYVKEFNQGDYILFPGQTVKAYNKLKVTEIRKIAEKKNINLYVSGLKKKTKKMLIEEILQL